MLFVVVQEGMGAAPPRVTLTGGNIPQNRQGLGQGKALAGIAWAMLGIPEQCTLPLLNWGSAIPANPPVWELLGTAVLLPDMVEPRGYS